MNEELNKILMNVQLLFDTGEITRKLERVREEYKRNIEPEAGIQTGFGHTLSRMSLTRFVKAVNRHSKDQEEEFRQYVEQINVRKRCNTGHYIKT